MPRPSKKEECKCGLLARLAKDPKNSIEFDARLNEYHILRRGNGGYSLIHFCPFCGGRAPKSRRGSIATQAKLVQQVHEFHVSPGVRPPEPEPPIDTRKRYDVYCIEPNREIVVYRNARFKGAGALLPAPAGRMYPDFVEIEQANGQSIFVSRSSIFRFCEPGTELVSEAVGPRKQDVG